MKQSLINLRKPMLYLDMDDVVAKLELAKSMCGQGKPVAIMMHTLMGKGIPFLEEREKNHFIRVDPPEWQQALDILDAAHKELA